MIIIAEGLCEENYNYYIHSKDLSDRAFHDCQLCDKRLQSTPSMWLLLRFLDKRKFVYVDRFKICAICVEYDGNDTTHNDK